MFEHFTESSRQVIVLAQEEARLLGHSYIGTEHLLLGLVRQEDDAVLAVLSAHELSLERARGDVVEVVPRGGENATGQIPFTPHAKRVLELSIARAKALEHNVITPLHLLLGLALAEGVGAKILLDHGLGAETLERVLAEYDPRRIRPEAHARRLALVEARLAATARRAEVMELIANAPDHRSAAMAVAERLGLDEELARDVTGMRLLSFAVAEVEKLRQERAALRAKLDQ